MSQDDQEFRFPTVPLLIFVVIILLILLIVQSMQRPATVTQPEERQETAPPQKIVPGATTPAPEESKADAPVLKEGREFYREDAVRQGVKLLAPEEVRSPEGIEGLKIAVQKDRVYDSLLKWNVVGKVEDKSWALRKVVNMVYIAEAAVVQTVEENDGTNIVVVYDFRSVKSFKALYELDSIKLDFMEGAPKVIRATTSVLAPICDLLVFGSGTPVRISGAVLAVQAKPVLENLTLQGYKMLFNPAKANDDVKMFIQVNTLEGKRVRVTHQKGAVAKIVPLGCELSASERNFCMNLGVLANYHLMPDPDKKVGQQWNVKASNFANMLEPTLRGVPDGELEIVLKDRDRDLATLEIVKGTIELDSSDPKSARIGKCTPKGTLDYDTKERYVMRGTLTADVSLERASRNHLLFETKFKTNPAVTIDYQCTKSAGEDKEITRFPELEKEKFQPIPFQLFSPF